MIKNCVVDGKKYFENAEDFMMWENSQKYSFELTAEEASLIWGYVDGHSYALCLDGQGAILLVDQDEPENEPKSICIEELIHIVTEWNYEFLLDDTVTGEWRECIVRDMNVLGGILDRIDVRDGYCIGTPTVKELIAILNKLPQDYRVTCCGTDNHLYLFHESKYLTIDCEKYLS